MHENCSAHTTPGSKPVFAVAVQFIHMLQRRVGEDAMKKAMERIIIGATAKLAQGKPPVPKPWQDRILATLDIDGWHAPSPS